MESDFVSKRLRNFFTGKQRVKLFRPLEIYQGNEISCCRGAQQKEGFKIDVDTVIGQVRKVPNCKAPSAQVLTEFMSKWHHIARLGKSPHSEYRAKDPPDLRWPGGGADLKSYRYKGKMQSFFCML